MNVFVCVLVLATLHPSCTNGISHERAVSLLVGLNKDNAFNLGTDRSPYTIFEERPTNAELLTVLDRNGQVISR